MYSLLLVVNIVVAALMIGLILIQQGKGADAGASFGAGASGTIFGAAGSGNALTKATSLLTVIFFATSLGLVYLSKHQNPLDKIVAAANKSGSTTATISDVPTATPTTTNASTDVPISTNTAAAPTNAPVNPVK